MLNFKFGPGTDNDEYRTSCLRFLLVFPLVFVSTFTVISDSLSSSANVFSGFDGRVLVLDFSLLEAVNGDVISFEGRFCSVRVLSSVDSAFSKFKDDRILCNKMWIK